jgi:hypothetical protein
VQKGCYENGGDADWRCPDAEKNEFPSEAAAHVAATSLLFRIVQAQKAGTWRGPVENEHWNCIRPAYGSLAYEEGNWSAIDAEEEARTEGR